MKKMPAALTVLAASIVVFGCGQKQTQLAPMPVEWPARDALNGATLEDQGFSAIEFASQSGDWKQVQQIASSEGFEARVNEFAQAEAPEGRTAQRDAVVENLRKLISGAKSKARPDVLRNACQGVSESLKAASAAQAGS